MKGISRFLRWDTFEGKLFVIMAGGTAATVFALTFIWTIYSWMAVSRSVQRDLQVVASRTAGEIDEYLSGKTALLTATRELLSYPRDDKFKLELMLKRLSLEFMEFRKLALFDASGEMLAVNSGTDETPYIPDYILKTVKSGKGYRSQILFTENNLPYMRIALPLFWQGEVFRVLIADIDMVGVWNKIDSIRIGTTGHAHILSQDGVFLAAANKEAVLKRENWGDFTKLKNPVNEKNEALALSDHEGKTVYAAYAEIPSAGWGLVISQERHEALHFLDTMVFQAFIIIFLSLVAAYFIASWMSNILSQPVYELYKGAKEISAENLEYKVPQLSGGEFSSLGEMFNTMGSSLAEKKKTENQLAKAERLAAVGRLAADVAHEINNPLAIIKNYVYIISKRKMPDDDPNQHYLGIIDREIDRIARIIRSFNEFYKGTQVVSFEQIDMTMPLREVIDFCKADMEGKGISIEEKLVNTATVTADKDKLKQVFLNLIKNAAEAMPNGGKVTLETIRDGGNISLSVTDTGIGIKKEHLARIFDPFFSTKGIKGTGLGLSVSYGIIKNMNGNIDVQSEEGKGATFKVTLPITN